MSSNENNNEEEDNAAISGTILWADDKGAFHPLQYLRIEIYNYNNVYIGSTHLDYEGKFNLTVSSQEICDKYKLKIYAESIYGKLYNESDTLYCIDTDYGDDNDEIKIYMGKTGNRAFQIIQAISVGGSFISQITGLNISSVNVSYPTQIGNTYYDPETLSISIEENLGESYMYSCWDVIMHEYGHFVQDYYNLGENPGGWHDIETNMYDHYSYHVDNPANTDFLRVRKQ